MLICKWCYSKIISNKNISSKRRGEIIMSKIFRNTNPAREWGDGYPVGNGRLGAMVVSKGNTERLSLNHDLLWRKFIKYGNTHTHKDVEEMKALCREGRYVEAEKVLHRTHAVTGHEIYVNPFVPVADLYLTVQGETENYERRLHMDEGSAVTEYTSREAVFQRKTIASAADNAILIRLSSNRGAFLDANVTLSRIDDCECEISAEATPNMLKLKGSFEEGGTFAVTTKIYTRGGRTTCMRKDYQNPPATSRKVFTTEYVFTREEQYNDSYGVQTAIVKASEAIIAVFISTDEDSAVHNLSPEAFNEKKLADFEQKYVCPEDMWDDMYQSHLEMFRKFYGETQLCLGDDQDTTNETLLEECEKSGEVSPELAERIFAFSRYLCVSAGMPQPEGEYPKAPINLQGLWNKDLFPGWDCDYHMDLNLEMCYWSMDELGLSQCVLPYMQWIERLLPQARKQAKDSYGCSGVIMNSCCDYKTLGRGDNVGYFWLGSAAWHADILWMHYEYTQDVSFLREHLLPFMSEISDFFSDMLIEDEEGFLIPPFGASPEIQVKHKEGNTFVYSASSIDIELIYSLFTHLQQAYDMLGCDERTARNMNILGKLPLPKIREDGCFSEFYNTEFEEAEPGHRHRSPLVGLCPGDRVSVLKTPEHAEAAYKLIQHRQQHDKLTISFIYPWDMQLLARLGRGEDAYEMLCAYSKYHLLTNLIATTNNWKQNHKGDGQTWFDNEKLFQIDACIAIGGGVLELFFVNRQGIMEFLPALPKQYACGELRNVPAKGGFEVSFSWKDGEIQTLSILSKLGNECKMVIPKGMSLSDFPGAIYIQEGVICFQTTSGTCINIK